jgi:hypothetical protein
MAVVGSQWAIPLYVALIAAAASVLAAIVASRKDRKDERAAVLQDIEIVDKLKDSPEIDTGMLEEYIQARVHVFAAEDRSVSFRRWSIFVDLAAIALSAASVFALQQYNAVASWKPPPWLFIIGSAWFLTVIGIRLHQYWTYPAHGVRLKLRDYKRRKSRKALAEAEEKLVGATRSLMTTLVEGTDRVAELAALKWPGVLGEYDEQAEYPDGRTVNERH